MSFYLKYRPQKTSELDIGAVREFYAGLLKSGKFAHAYLFSGPRGTGKTSSARILAKLINCEKNKEAVEKGTSLQEPCGKCNMCKRVVAGNSLAVVEMDAASNRGIDDIRALREKIALTPAEGSHIVYIIDEVHMLTTEAFNALLKTLEEPPEHAIFALCTTEFHKLPETVVSRCTTVIYPKATVEEVRGSLGKIVKGEKIKISDEALTWLAQSADGSFRDATKMFEQLVAAGNEIADEAVQKLVKMTGQYDPKPLIESLLQKDMQKALTIVGALDQAGTDVAVYAKRGLDELRERLVAAMKNKGSDLSSLIMLTEMMSQAALAIKTAYVAVLPLEILVAKWCSDDSSEYVVSRIEQKKQESRTMSPTKTRVSAPKPQMEKTPISESAVSAPKKEEMAKKKIEYKEGDPTLEEMEGNWETILAKVKPFNHSIEALLRSSRPKEVIGNQVVLEVFYKFHKEKLEEEKHRSVIEDAIGEVLQKKVILTFVLRDSKLPKPKVKKKTAAPSKSGGGEDLVSAAEEIFG